MKITVLEFNPITHTDTGTQKIKENSTVCSGRIETVAASTFEHPSAGWVVQKSIGSEPVYLDIDGDFYGDNIGQVLFFDSQASAIKHSIAQDFKNVTIVFKIS